jgi:hypothetical protein
VVGWFAPAAAGRVFPPSTFLLSATPSGRLPNGASCCGVVSHDRRAAAVMAYESLASNISPGTRLGVANVYAVFRRGAVLTDGSPWLVGRTALVSHALHGAVANGPSYAPALSGTGVLAPRCVAFISRASNLVSGDHNHAADAFVEDLASERITRVSLNSSGREANGDTTGVAVSGDCHRVAFVSHATNLAQTKSRPGVRGARTDAPRRGTSEVYMRFLAGGAAGLTMLVSAHGVHPANRDVAGLSMGRDGTAVAFATSAGNLGVPARGVSQVWQRLVTVVGRQRRGTRISGALRLVSEAPGGAAGDGPSTAPSIDHDGLVVAFATAATNLITATRLRSTTLLLPTPTCRASGGR